MAEPANDLNARIAKAAQSKVGKRALKSKFGIDCFALVDNVLRSEDAMSASDFGKVTSTADYTWGDGIIGADSLRPGDIIQFRNHVVNISTQVLNQGKWFETESRTLTRGHHSAIVIRAPAGGAVVVVEQNLLPNPKKVRRSVIPKLDAGKETRRLGEGKREVITVTGDVWFYHPVPRPKKGAFLIDPEHPVAFSGHRFMGHVVPAQGGRKRLPGPVGISQVVGDQEASGGVGDPKRRRV